MEFLEDFREEAEELLASINRHLLALSEDMALSARQPLFLELLRAFHTLKGLVGMMSLEQAGEICHHSESLLNRARRGELEGNWLDLLLQGSRVLARIVHGLPERPELAEAATTLEQLQQFGQQSAQPQNQVAATLEVPDEIAAHLREDDWHRLHQGIRDGLQVGLAYFMPASDLAAEGINVNRARETLLASGDLVKAVPLVEGSQVRFAFLCLHSRPPETLSGLSWQALQQSLAEQQFEPLSPAPEEGLRQSGHSVRVEVGRLDDIMRLVGDLVVSRWRLQNALDCSEIEERVGEPIRDSATRIERQLRELRQAVMRARMVPLAEVFARMPLALRDLARTCQCQVRLEMTGQEAQVDKVLVERLLDPLLHLVRNALAHGLESPQERVAQGKPPEGTVRLSAHPQGDSIRIEVEDDGRGLDLEAIARAAGVRAELDPAQALEILCRPGFSTRLNAARDAGRGVGMDVVRTAVREMGGHLGVESQPGLGCRFWMRLPLTLTIVDSFLLAMGDERYAVARDSVAEVVEVSPGEVLRHAGGEMFQWRGTALPLVHLRKSLGVPGPPPPQLPHALVCELGERRVAFVVDRVVGLREVVVRPVVDPLLARPWLGGATELGDGTIALILDLSQVSIQDVCR